MLMTGDDDEPAIGPDLPRRIIYDRSNPPHFYLVMKNATHFVFSNRGCGGQLLYRAVDENPQIRSIGRYGLAFFDRHLRPNLSSTSALDAMEPVWAYYLKEEIAGQTFSWGVEPPPGQGGPAGIWHEFRQGR